MFNVYCPVFHEEYQASLEYIFSLIGNVLDIISHEHDECLDLGSLHEE